METSTASVAKDLSSCKEGASALKADITALQVLVLKNLRFFSKLLNSVITFPQKIDFAAYGLHRDHPPAWDLIKNGIEENHIQNLIEK